MRNIESIHLLDGSDFGFAAAETEDLLGEDGDSDNLSRPVLSLTQYPPNNPNTLQSNLPTIAENPPRSSTSSMPAGICVICNDAPVYRDGQNIYVTCGMACTFQLHAASLSHLRNLNKPRTSDSDPPNSAFMSSSSVPPNISDDNWESPSRSSEPARTYADITHSHSRPKTPNQIRMCDVCHVRPHAPGSESVEMCDYCKMRPKVVINGETYPLCGKTCRDKARPAKTAANAAVRTSCILCWKSTKAGESVFCSVTCNSLANIRAPFLIEIPRSHVGFEKVAEFFTSEWRTSKTHCPTIKRVYMVVMKESFITSFEKYRKKIDFQNARKGYISKRWLVFSRECGFGDPGDLEPCCSNKCLLCSIVRSSFNRSDFPRGITTSGLNRTVECNRSGKNSSSKIVAFVNVIVGRKARMGYRDLLVNTRPLPPQNADSVHIIEYLNDGSKVDSGDNIVYDGDAVRPLYLISYK